MTYELPDDTIIERIDKALAEWADEGRKKPDTLFLGMRELLALDKILNMVVFGYKGMAVVATDKLNFLGIGNVY